MRRSLLALVCLLTPVALGCASGPLVRQPVAAMAIRQAWPQVHLAASAAGVCSDVPPTYLVERLPPDEPALASPSAAAPAPAPAPVAPGAPSAPSPAPAAPSAAPAAPTPSPAPGKGRGGGVDGTGDRR